MKSFLSEGKIPEDVEAMALVNLGSLSCKSMFYPKPPPSFQLSNVENKIEKVHFSSFICHQVKMHVCGGMKSIELTELRNACGSLGDYEQQRSVTERGLKMQEQIYGVLSAWLRCFRCFLLSNLSCSYGMFCLKHLEPG